jgi:hypothetical protein
MTKKKAVLSVILVVVAAVVVAAFTVPITVGGKKGPAEPGAANYAAPLASKALPPIPPKFGGVIKDSALQSTTWWPPAVVPPKGAPNVLLIMTDDVGFGAPSTFGGVIPTPALDRVAQIGVGVVLLPFPQVAALLLDASLDGTGLLVARGLGGAALALGLTWWIVRNDSRAVARCAAGFIIYNVVVGALFAFQALQAARPPLPWLVGIVHLLAGGAFAAATAFARATPVAPTRD